MIKTFELVIKDKLQGEARRNPKRAAAAVSAAVIRGNRTGGADPAEVKNLKAEIKRLNKVISDNQKMATQQDCSELLSRLDLMLGASFEPLFVLSCIELMSRSELIKGTSNG